jgi:L-alanine-DL-glutamate epimerase-like enolase superfamily enzyme
MKEHRITSVELTPVNVPFVRPERWSFGSLKGMTSIIVQVRTEGGLTGVGEAVSGGPSINVMMTALRELGLLLEGRDATAIEANVRYLTYAGGWHWYGRRTAVVLSGLEMAMWDLLGKALNAPLHRLLGGPLAAELPIMYFLIRGEKSTSELVDEARDAVATGFETVYIKGGNDVEDDIDVLANLRDALGERVRLRLDLNEGWMPSTAVRALRRLEPLNLEFVEQPVRFSELSQLARLREATAVPIAANQSGWTPREIMEIVRLGAADVVVTDAHQEGGISGLRRAIEICEAAGLPVVYHAFTTMSIGIAASMQVMCAHPNCLQMAHQFYPPGFLEDDLVTQPLEPIRGHVRIPSGPGIGLELDGDKLEEAAGRFRSEGAYPLFEADRAPAWVPMG